MTEPKPMSDKQLVKMNDTSNQLVEDDGQRKQSFLKIEKTKFPSHQPDTHDATFVNKTSHVSKLDRNVKTTAVKKSKKISNG